MNAMVFGEVGACEQLVTLLHIYIDIAEVLEVIYNAILCLSSNTKNEVQLDKTGVCAQLVAMLRSNIGNVKICENT